MLSAIFTSLQPVLGQSQGLQPALARPEGGAKAVLLYIYMPQGLQPALYIYMPQGLQPALEGGAKAG